ncbi:MAG: hypothetical protein R2744_06710 [Bacteroidales bacterium]
MKYFTSYKNSRALKLFLLLLVAISIFSCSPTKYVSDNETLLFKSDIKMENMDMKKSDLVPYVKQVPNKKILVPGFTWGSIIFQILRKEGWFHRWLRNIGEEPVVFDMYSTEKSKEQARELPLLQGYFNSTVGVDLFTRKRRQMSHIILLPGNRTG